MSEILTLFNESYGTVRFVNLFPLVAQAIATGGTLVVGEFDASIHPMALMSIVGVFHNDDVNKHGAQLIFNTHNPASCPSRFSCSKIAQNCRKEP